MSYLFNNIWPIENSVSTEQSADVSTPDIPSSDFDQSNIYFDQISTESFEQQLSNLRTMVFGNDDGVILVVP